MPAEWGTDLWDQYDAIAVHTQKGIDFLDRFSQFYKERCKVEINYARDLKNTVKSFQPKKKDDEDTQYSYFRGFSRMASEVHDLAAQHERLAEDFQTAIVAKVQAQSKELRDERKKYLDEASRIQKHLELYIQQLEKSKKFYEKAFKEAQRAHEAYLRADENQELSRKAVEDAKMAAGRKQQEFESAKQDYASKLQETNQYQRNFYQSLMPSVFQRMQELDQKKTAQIRDSIKQAVEIERKIQPIIDRCLQEMIRSAEEVLPEIDSQVVVDRYKSGFEHPADIPFWNLEDAKSVDNGTINNHYPPIRSGSMRSGTMQTERKQRKTIINIFPGAKTKESSKEDFSDLPPEQRKRRLKEKLDAISQQMTQETLTRDALLKMKGVYEASPSMGDPNSVNGQLNENSVKLENLRNELNKLQSLLDDELHRTGNGHGTIRGHSNSASNINTSSSSLINPNGQQNNSGSGSADSLVPSRSPSESSMPLPHQNHHNNHHRDSLGNHGPPSSLPSDEHDHDQDLYEVAPGEEEAVGSCLALYDFDGQSDGALSMTESEELLILEVDQGDGWTHVRRATTHEEGFVPTSYVKVTLFHALNHRHP